MVKGAHTRPSAFVSSKNCILKRIEALTHRYLTPWKSKLLTFLVQHTIVEIAEIFKRSMILGAVYQGFYTSDGRKSGEYVGIDTMET